MPPTTGSTEAYHLTDGSWYRIEQSYLAWLRDYLDPMCCDVNLPPYNQGIEGEYNKHVAEHDQTIICLDTSNISPHGQRQVEPYDLYCAKEERALFYHVKVPTLSMHLSHLFNQGANAMELLRLEPQAVDKLHTLLMSHGEQQADSMMDPVVKNDCDVIYAIVTHKDTDKKSDNLRLFSKISLMRSLKALTLMGVRGRFGFVSDKTAKPTGKKKKRKTRQQTSAAAQAFA